MLTAKQLIQQDSYQTTEGEPLAVEPLSLQENLKTEGPVLRKPLEYWYVPD